MVVPAQIRNLVLMAHGGAGKTSLVESLAFVGGAISGKGAWRTATPSPISTPTSRSAA